MYLTQGLHRALQCTPDATATVFGGRTRTFAEHTDRIAPLAGGLRSIGIATDDRVGIVSLSSDRYAEYLPAVLWADAVLNPVNIRWNPAEIAYSIDDSDARVLLIDDAFAPIIPVLRDSCPGLRTIVYCGEGATPENTVSYETLVADSKPVDDARRCGDSLAGIFYTGGTTGFPKGVMLSHANMVTSALGTVSTGELLSGDASFLHAAPMFHLADRVLCRRQHPTPSCPARRERNEQAPPRSRTSALNRVPVPPATGGPRRNRRCRSLPPRPPRRPR
ncbi:AMP-binding protein [Rhodococcus opacus]|uniref:AMP-binding protein n=1 Tax=Rhodococcus opacus TaxID=37919 RepID=UPI001FF41F50|nr:AMP-binding protein [Rhodococcus opacus]UOT03514.1 AMP-binding protein [Rhodococcus opacus]